MYFSTNVMFLTLHSNATIYLSTRLPSGDVRVHIEVSQPLTVGVGRVTEGTKHIAIKHVDLKIKFITQFAPVFINVAHILVIITSLVW